MMKDLFTKVVSGMANLMGREIKHMRMGMFTLVSLKMDKNTEEVITNLQKLEKSMKENGQRMLIVDPGK